VFRIRIGSGYNSACGSGSKAKNYPQKKKEVKKFYVFKAGCSLWGPGGFSWSLKAFYRSQKKEIIHFKISNILNLLQV
jgi:hypothetical protein